MPKRRRRRGIPALVPVFLILLLAIVLIVATRPRDAGKQPSSETGDPLAPKTLTIAAAGDVTVTQALLDSGKQADGQYDFTDTFLRVAHLLGDADLTLCNLEANFCGAPYAAEQYQCPEALLTALARVGVDFVQTANTASIYNGTSGLQATISAVKAAGMEPVGTFPSPEAASSSGGYTIVEANGIRVALVAFTKGVGNLNLPEGMEHCVNLLYTDYSTTYQEIDRAGILRVLDRIREEKPDITLALLHWGSENDRTVSDTQEKIRRLMLEGGVDVILGTHSHLVGPIEEQTVSERKTLTAFSLGNLAADTQDTATNQGIVLKLEITKADGVTTVTGYDYTPIYLAGPEEAGKLQVMDTARAIALCQAGSVDALPVESLESLERSLERVARYTAPREQEES